MPLRLLLLPIRLLLLALACCAGLVLAADRPPPDGAVVLDDGHPVVDAWPAVRLFSDPDGSLGPAEAASLLARFEAPASPAGSLGPRRDVVWLHVPLQVAGGDGRWVLDIDYPALNDVQVHLLQGGRLQTLAPLGSSRPFAQRPMPTRSHALELQLEPGQRHDLLLRVKTDSAMVLPITLNKPDAYQTRESHMLLGQGLMLGVALTLLVYALAYGLSLREPLFALYAAMLLGSTAFFVDFFGIGQLVLWSERRGLTAMVSPLSVLLAMAAGTQFVTRSMEMRQRNPRLFRALQGVSVISAIALALGLLGLLNYRQAQLVATVVGPVVPLLIMPAAWQRARSGEAVGRWMLVGWSAYLVGACTTAALLRGLLPANFWTLHLFQWGTAVEMLAWLRVLSLYIEAVRREAQRAAAEKRRLESLAHTDALTGQPCRVGLTIGYALAPQDSQDGAELLRLADAAMYAGKQAGRHQVRRGRLAEATA